jgi:hypothetical protein
VRHPIAVIGLLIGGWTVSADDAPTDVDVAKTIERIKEDADKASKNLGDKDPGVKTQQLQKEVMKRIDDLIRKAQQPPPMNDNSTSSNSNPAPMPMGSDSSAAAQRKERRQKNALANNGGTQPKDRTTAPMPRLDPSPSLGSTRPMTDMNEPFRATMPLRITDRFKDAWGHLPEKVRQEVDLYFREQFMPRYSELLRQYYSSLAERNSRSDP